MTEWTIHIDYGTKRYQLKAVVEYESSQIMRIRVHGKERSILLENDYPLLQYTKSKKAIKWKLREGGFDGTDQYKNAVFLTDLLGKLEDFVKGKHLQISAAEYLRQNKR